MTIALIAAASENNAIGIHNQLPWNLPEDLKFFKRITLGKPVIMGRKTFEALGKPLPGRVNIVLSHSGQLDLPEGVLHFATLQEAIGYSEHHLSENTDEIFVIGGGQIFELALPIAERIYLTRVHTTIAGADAFFPVLDHTHWKVSWEEQHKADEKHKFDYTFQQLERTEL